MEADDFCCTKFDFNEWRKKGVKTIRILSLLQLILGFVSLIVGIVSLWFTVSNPSFPKTNGYAVASGVMLLVASVLGYSSSHANFRDEEERMVRRRVILHNVMNNSCMVMSLVQIIFSIVALVNCYSLDTTHEICQPHAFINRALYVLVIVTGALVFKLCFIGSVLFCVLRRQFECLTPQQAFQHEKFVDESEPVKRKI